MSQGSTQYTATASHKHRTSTRAHTDLCNRRLDSALRRGSEFGHMPCGEVLCKIYCKIRGSAPRNHKTSLTPTDTPQRELLAVGTKARSSFGASRWGEEEPAHLTGRSGRASRYFTRDRSTATASASVGSLTS
eukprot:7315824-Prymnesium_polylepis.2